MIDGSMGTVRQIATQLRPAMLDDIGLAATVEWQLEEFEALTGIRSIFTLASESVRHDASELVASDGSAPALDRDVVTTAFRILQEALTNVQRHAAATQIEVSLALQGGQLQMRIHDNGRGIADKDMRSLKSIGLLGMRERARSIGGEAHITGVAGQGTTVEVHLPVKRA